MRSRHSLGRLYRGEVIGGDYRDDWLNMMWKGGGTAFTMRLPASAQARAYPKNGWIQASNVYPVNFYNELGIVETAQGAFALAVFTSGNPEHPGFTPVAALTRIVYDYFVSTTP